MVFGEINNNNKLLLYYHYYYNNNNNVERVGLYSNYIIDDCMAIMYSMTYF